MMPVPEKTMSEAMDNSSRDELRNRHLFQLGETAR